MTPSATQPIRHRGRRMTLLASWLFLGLVVVSRAAVVQVGQGSRWEAAAQAQQR